MSGVLYSAVTEPVSITRDAPDTVFAGYPANPKAGYQISGR
jgi:hypothetical protein